MSSCSYSGNQDPNNYSRSAPDRKWIYDVFVSFRNEDSRHNFVSELYARLESAGVHVFKDEMEPRSGDQILFQAIEDSMISIVVFSRNYANSTWCLQELDKIMECRRRNKGQEVIPVFCGLDPSEVRDQTGHLEGALARVEERKSMSKNKVSSFRNALTEAAAITGFTIDFRRLSEVLENIVERVTDLLDSTQLFVAEHPVGVQSWVQDCTQLLNCHISDNVILLGIWGMGGVGKTTLAKALYNQISRDFEGRKFLTGIRDRWEKSTVSLQEELLSCIYKTMTTRIHNIESGKLVIKKSLCSRKVFLVLDDVTNLDQLKALCGSREWFGPGSRIIITTRDKHLLYELEVDYVYEVRAMDYNESVELFSWNAFKKATPEGHVDELVKRVVEYCGGIPLALEVLGSFLSGKSPEEWERALEEFNKDSQHSIDEVLKSSFDSTSDTGKEVFLEIACFFVGMDRNDVIQILSSSIHDAEMGMIELQERSLVYVDKENKLQMHDLIQGMARGILHEAPQIKPEPRTYDVFLSFRGKDTRTTFTSHLHASLENTGAYVFKDEATISRGERISISLLKAIRDSRLSIIVLSTHYADSRWCLNELEIIMECYRAKSQIVVPIFYGVDPSEVRNQRGKFGEAFKTLVERIQVKEDKVLSWRTALREVCSLAGTVVVNSRNESDDIKKVVEDVTRLLDKTELFVADYPVGVTPRVQEVIELLNNHPSKKDVILLGICGMGGIGKTTLAKAIYNRIGRNFDGRSFLLNIREVWDQDNGKVSLQEGLLHDVYKATKIVIRNIDSGKNDLKYRLSHKKVLVVLDDISKLEQMNALFGSHEWFGKGSCIIITTRYDRLVRVRGVEPIIYSLKQMNENEAIELFSWHAFKQASPKEQFVGLSGDLVAYSSGLPLALQVLGSHLYDRKIVEWEDVLDKLKKIPHHEIQEKLRISFDGLSDDDEKEIFLDIACFFIGMDQSDVIEILNDCGFYARNGIKVLIERNLVTVDNKNKLGMHNLLRDMGREIIRERSPEPEERSRLWIHEEVLDILKKYKGTKYIKGLTLKLLRKNPISLCTEAFKKMKKLRLLQLAGVRLDGDFRYLSNDLRWINWHGFQLSHTPKNCHQESLIAIELEYSNLKLMWKEARLLNKLKILNLSHSHHLRETPDFSYLPNLEKLKLKDCPSLSSVSHTIGHLNKLLLINLKKCTSLRRLPRSIYKLKSLKTLILSGCLLIEKFEEDLEQMESLAILKADNTKITRVPNAVIRMKSIGYISLCGFEGLARDVIPSIIWSWTSPTNKPSSLMQTSFGKQFSASLPNFLPKRGSQLQITGDGSKDTFSAINCKELESRPTKSQVPNMDASSALVGCRRQGDIPGSKSLLSSFLIRMGMNSPITETLERRISQELRNSGPGDCLLPGDNNPFWLTFKGEGSFVTFEVPRVNGRNLKTVMLCIVYSSSTDIITSDVLIKNMLIINYTKGNTQVYEGDRVTSLKDEDWQSIISNLEPGDKVHIVVIHGFGSIVKKTAVYLVYDEPIDQNMEYFDADHVFVPGNDIVSGGDDMPADNQKYIISGGDKNEDISLKKRKLPRF